MIDATLETPVGQLAAQLPAALPVLERCGVDYCCGGDRSLAAACRQAEVDPQQVLDEIHRQTAAAGPPANYWWTASLTALCDHIEQTHHAFLRQQLPFLTDLIDKVVAAHADNHSELLQVRDTFAALRAELEPHMAKEEQVLFPAVRALEAQAPPQQFCFGTMQNPIDVMEDEHSRAGAALQQLRQLTGGYQAPADACSAYRGLLESLRQLEADLHQHIHKENNILFPRAVELEGAAAGA